MKDSFGLNFEDSDTLKQEYYSELFRKKKRTKGIKLIN